MSLKSLNIQNFKCFKSLDLRDLSTGINLFLGPNGSGKTSLFNVIRMLVCREALNSQTEFTEGRKRIGLRTWLHDFNEPTKPWSGKATFRIEDLAEDLVLSIKFEPGGEEPTRTLSEAPVRGDKLTRAQALLRNRVFYPGWPRRLASLSSFRAFERIEEDSRTFPTNADAFAGVWKEIQEAANEFLGIKSLGQPPSTPEESQIFCETLRDDNGRPVLENSDGLSHALYLIMEIEKHPWPTTFLLEEPDVYLHPGLQRRFVDYVQARCLPRSDGQAGHQFLIATHSPHMVNGVAEICRKLGEGSARLFQMIRKNNAVSIGPLSSDDDHWNALMGIGHRPSDVLLPNGLIWVEGPSDVIYLKHWLSKYAKEMYSYDIAWGRDAEILWYGGNQWANMAGKNVLWDGMDDDRFQSLLNILKINHNASVVIDRDEDNSQRKNKERLSAELSQSDPPRHVWMTEHRCIEFYIKAHPADTSLEQIFRKCRSVDRRPKVQRAREYVACTESKLLEEIVDLDTDIRRQLQTTYDYIRRWAGQDHVC